MKNQLSISLMITYILILFLLAGCDPSVDECKDPKRPWNYFDPCHPKRPIN